MKLSIPGLTPRREMEKISCILDCVTDLSELNGNLSKMVTISFLKYLEQNVAVFSKNVVLIYETFDQMSINPAIKPSLRIHIGQCCWGNATLTIHTIKQTKLNFKGSNQ